VKFLADEQFPHIATLMLRRLGWDIRELTSVADLRGKDDVDVVLRYAKRTRRVLLSVDSFEDRATRARMWSNLRGTRRGMVLSVSGGPEQHWQRIVGKLLFHGEAWQPFFESGHGVVQIGDLKPDRLRMTRPEDLPRLEHSPARQGATYLHRPKQLPLPRPRRSPAAVDNVRLEGLE
jgi:Domain of unknown function (DUF5615)